MAVRVGLIRKTFIVAASSCFAIFIAGPLAASPIVQETNSASAPEAAASSLISEIENDETFQSDAGKALLHLLGSDNNVSPELKRMLLLACMEEDAQSKMVETTAGRLTASLNPELFKAISQDSFLSESSRYNFDNLYSHSVRSNLSKRAELTIDKTNEMLETLDTTRVFANAQLKQVKKNLTPANELLAFIKHRIAHMQRLQKQVPSGSGIQKDGQLYTASDFKKLIAERKEQLVGQSEICKLLEQQNQFLRKFYKQIKSDASECKNFLGQQETQLKQLKSKQVAFEKETADTDDEESARTLQDEVDKLMIATNQVCNQAESKLELVSQRTAQSKEQYEALAKAAKRQSALNALDDLTEIEDK